jgi:hypothetical protein
VNPCRFRVAVIVVSIVVALGVATAVAGGRPPSKLGPELIALYDAYLAASTSGRPLVVPDPALQIVEDRVVVEAVATDDVADLKAGLAALGMRGAVTAGRLVSGQLPIVQIPAMAALPGLRFARAAMMAPRGGAGQGAR